jgi:hypothetical protein
VVCRLDLEHGCVRPLGQLIRGVAEHESRKPDADANPSVRLDRVSDQAEAPLGFLEIGSTDPAHELVASIANDRIEGAESGTDFADNGLQHTIARRVAFTIVDDLQAIDVDECHDELPIRTARPVDFMRERHSAHLAAVGAGEFVEVGRPQLCLEPIPLASGGRPVGGGAGTISGGPRTISTCLGTKLFDLPDQIRLGFVKGRRGNCGSRVACATELISHRRVLIALGRCQLAIMRRI